MMNDRAKKPFLVYAVDSPGYPNFDTVYARGTAPAEVAGSLVVVSGGHISTGADEGCQEVFTYGCMALKDDVGCRFVERVLAGIIEAEERVVILYVVRDDEWVETVRAAGFEVTLAVDTEPGYASDFAVCVGTGKMLREFEWMQEVLGYDQFCVLASRGEPSVFERQMVRTARVGINPVNTAADIIAEMDKNPECIPEMLGDFNLFAWFTDPDLSSIRINRSSPDVSNVGPLFKLVAADLGVALYDAGSLRDLDEHGDFFTDFKNYEEWQPIPRHWQRVV